MWTVRVLLLVVLATAAATVRGSPKFRDHSCFSDTESIHKIDDSLPQDESPPRQVLNTSVASSSKSASERLVIASVAVPTKFQSWKWPEGVPTPNVTQPQLVSTYGFDGSGQWYCPGRVPKYRAARPGVSLASGIESYISSMGDWEWREHLHHVLKALAHRNIDVFATATNFVSSRYNFQKLLGSIYQCQPWTIRAVKFSKIIFLDYVHQDAEWTQTLSKENLEMSAFFGDKFAAVSTLTEHDDERKIVNSKEKFYGVFSTQLNSHHLLLAAKIDCEDEKNRFVELKTSHVIDDIRHERVFEEEKLLRFWINSYLVGINKVIVGFRDGEGTLKLIQELQVSSFPGIGYSNRHWNWKACLHLADEVLTMLQTNLEEGDFAEVSFAAPFTHIELRQSERSDRLDIEQIMSSVNSTEKPARK